MNNVGFSCGEIEAMKGAAIGEAHLGRRLPIDQKEIPLSCVPAIITELHKAGLVI